MNNGIIIAAAIVAAAVIVKFVDLPATTTGKYQVAGAGTGIWIRLDTKTGDAWIGFGNGASGWTPFADNGAR